MSRRLSCLAAVAAALVLAPSLARAQQNIDTKNLKIANNIKGTIKSVDGNTGVIAMTDGAGKPAYVKVQQGTVFAVEGTADPTFLQPGIVVDFSADADSKGQLANEIKEMRVTELSTTVEPAFAPEVIGKGFDPKEKEKVVKCFIRGVVTANKDGDLQIKAGNNVIVKGKVAADAKISVSVTDYRLAQEGDSLDMSSGWEYQPGLYVGKSVVIKCAQALVPKKKGPPVRKKPGTK